MSKADRLYTVRLQQAAELGRMKHRHNVVTDLVRTTGKPAVVPSVHIDKRRITLAGLRFMGEEPHPVQLAIMADEELPA